MKSMTLLAALLTCLAPGSFAQATNWAPRDSIVGDSLLMEAIRLATEGQADSAQSLVRRRLASLSPRDPLYPGALFTAGLVADHGDTALAYFRTVSIEHSRSQWADQALLRMAELRFAAGELRSAARSAERILLDYPFSDALPRAAYWAGRAYLELGESDNGCDLLRRAGASAGDDIELSNRSRYYLQRCGGAVADSAAREISRTSTGSRSFFAVQVAAVRSAAGADELMQALSREGYEPHVVREPDGLLKIRVGRFANRADAEAIVGELRRKFGGEPFVVEQS
ncbi:MAG: SPOR domain-containing protein [Gemmatimonadota bacterium]|nr:MAG: SPOR domain-containing protein [Gemmatimonadota bacterium]